MTKAEGEVLKILGFTVATVALIKWLRSKPACDLGCQNQLEHLEKHVLSIAANRLLAVLVVLLGIR
jgi:hypothetical protein